MVEKIGFVSVISAQAARDVASSGDAMRKMTENMASSLQRLAEMAKQLDILTAQFKVTSPAGQSIFNTKNRVCK
ncbi:hypothetical protein ULO1_13350 [Carboxydocella sp. ULO1]|nr:hypothetical protein ULO1_13350 [Carboxydocella sp. ULO1]